MIQAFLKKGSVLPFKVPEPTIRSGFLKIEVLYSTISAGTEISSIIGSSQTLMSRVVNDPQKIIKVKNSIKKSGVGNAFKQITSSVEKVSSLGYSISGRIIEVGEGVDSFCVGDLVSAGGSGFAVHASVIVVPKNLVTKIPSGLDIRLASVATVGSIALHGIRRAGLRIGEYAVVYGVGLIGIISLQILKAAGVRVACVDINIARLEIAQKYGADLTVNPEGENPVLAIKNWTDGYGADAVVFLASTKDSFPLSLSFEMCRKKGKVIMVGVSGMAIKREDMYRNEIDLLISTSYGPGRYDDEYEIGGVDYPYSYVRWTENRNIVEILRLISEEKITFDKLNPAQYKIEDVQIAYKNLNEHPESHILTFLEYPENSKADEESLIQVNVGKKTNKKRICVGFIGAGNFAASDLLPIIYRYSKKFRLKYIVNRTSEKAVNLSRQFNAEYVSNNIDDILNDSEVDLVMICTSHDSHANLVLKCLEANKHVYVEKPLATTLEQLESIEEFYAYATTDEVPLLMVGFNRRYSDYAKIIKQALHSVRSPIIMHYRMNAGFVPYESWIHKDGGRIIGEACHIFDLFSYLADSEIEKFSVNSLQPTQGKFKGSDNMSISVSFANGAVGVLDYFSCGSHQLSKEHLEIHGDNKSIVLDDYKTLKGYGINLNGVKLSKPGKGHREELLAVYNAVRAGGELIPISSLLNTTRISILAGSPEQRIDSL